MLRTLASHIRCLPGFEKGSFIAGIHHTNQQISTRCVPITSILLPNGVTLSMAHSSCSTHNRLFISHYFDISVSKRVVFGSLVVGATIWISISFGCLMAHFQTR